MPLFDETPLDPLLRRKDAARLLGVSSPTLWRWEKDGKLPPARRLSPGVVGWPKSELLAKMTLAQRLFTQHGSAK